MGAGNGCTKLKFYLSFSSWPSSSLPLTQTAQLGLQCPEVFPKQQDTQVAPSRSQEA